MTPRLNFRIPMTAEYEITDEDLSEDTELQMLKADCMEDDYQNSWDF
jgi:hypothetical protein